MLGLRITSTGGICKGPLFLSGDRGEGNFETSVLKAKLRMKNRLRATTKMATRYIIRSVFSLWFCIGSFRIYGFCAFFWKTEAMFRGDDGDKRFPWAQAVTKSYSEQRPNIMRQYKIWRKCQTCITLWRAPLAWESPMDQLFVLLFPASSFANTFLLRTVSFWTWYMLEWLQLCTVYAELRMTAPACQAEPWTSHSSSSVA